MHCNESVANTALGITGSAAVQRQIGKFPIRRPTEGLAFAVPVRTRMRGVVPLDLRAGIVEGHWFEREMKCVR